MRLQLSRLPGLLRKATRGHAGGGLARFRALVVGAGGAADIQVALFFDAGIPAFALAVGCAALAALAQAVGWSRSLLVALGSELASGARAMLVVTTPGVTVDAAARGARRGCAADAAAPAPGGAAARRHVRAL